MWKLGNCVNNTKGFINENAKKKTQIIVTKFNQRSSISSEGRMVETNECATII